MKNDPRRTPKFSQAIQERLKGTSVHRLPFTFNSTALIALGTQGLTVLDLGTGPFALLALMAARAGAEKV